MKLIVAAARRLIRLKLIIATVSDQSYTVACNMRLVCKQVTEVLVHLQSVVFNNVMV